MHWYTDVIRRYADFDGRSGRPEFWWYQLFNLIVYIVVVAIVSVVAGFSTGQLAADLYSLAVLLPGLGVGIRRLHDINRSGWWLVLGIIPIVGAIVLIVFAATAGTPGPNRYGAPPSGNLAESAAY
jgi:uncharacterized membrane protein YhaH (DUF805 family)